VLRDPSYVGSRDITEGGPISDPTRRIEHEKLDAAASHTRSKFPEAALDRPASHATHVDYPPGVLVIAENLRKAGGIPVFLG
jgi:hypothetical protein